MQVTVRFTGPIRALAGRQRDAVSLPNGATVRDLLRALAEAMPGPFVQEILTPLETGGAPLALLLVNAANLRSPADLDRPLGDGDIIAFVPPMGGG